MGVFQGWCRQGIPNCSRAIGDDSSVASGTKDVIALKIAAVATGAGEARDGSLGAGA